MAFIPLYYSKHRAWRTTKPWTLRSPVNEVPFKGRKKAQPETHQLNRREKRNPHRYTLAGYHQ